MFSALPLKADVAQRTRYDRFVPRRDMPLSDNLVRTGHQRGWNLDAKFLRSLEVNEKFKFGRLLDRDG
jgi:hypothetical protein